MKKNFLFLGLIILLSTCPVLAQDNISGAGITKYAVLETTFNYSPVRDSANPDAKRFTHLKEGILLFSDEQNSKFYKVDLGLDKPYWIEKRYVKAQDTVFEKKGSKVSKIKFYQNRKNYLVKIDTPVQTPYKIYQRGNNLEFRLFNVEDNKKNVKVKYKNTADKFNWSIKNAPHSKGILTVNYKNTLPVYGYDVIKKDNALVFEIKKPLKINPKKPLKGIKIALDPGHGGWEPGVVAGGYKEKDVNLEITKELNKALKKRGAKTVLTRKKDVYTDLYDRVDFAKEKRTDFFISVHQNSLPNPANYEKKHGAGVYYYNENAKPLAYSVQKGLVAATGFKDDGVFNRSFAVTRTTNPVSILVECGYLIHPYERAKLTDKKFQKTVAKGIANGVEAYLKSTGL